MQHQEDLIEAQESLKEKDEEIATLTEELKHARKIMKKGKVAKPRNNHSDVSLSCLRLPCLVLTYISWKSLSLRRTIPRMLRSNLEEPQQKSNLSERKWQKLLSRRNERAIKSKWPSRKKARTDKRRTRKLRKRNLLFIVVRLRRWDLARNADLRRMLRNKRAYRRKRRES